ncbi:hypothetical protein GCM10011383_31650 [Hymenobacter cavernae]|uniref:Secretion system C-terminal sorting domain-containing protein n=1 Tax=Hymenobacter cavernae TaxID=2044852 RepID=A0ABQ1UFS8_9BACT|nr:hypothetical protein GCM10011383_31650 [Hymenobacter cavernae]
MLGYSAATAINGRATYTDLGNSGVAIATANIDDAVSDPQEIGFPFTFNGQPFTQFILSTNGFIKLGATPLSYPALLDPIESEESADVNIIAPSSYADLEGAADQTANPTSFRVATTGAVGSRVCTIQFKNLRDKTSASAPGQMNTMQFQIKLYEGTNIIDFVYGTWTASTATPLGQLFIVGLKGSGVASSDFLLASKPSSATAWSTTTFANPAPQFLAHFVRNTFLPDAGRTYRFAPAPPNDANVAVVYTLGQLPIPLTTPHVIRALVTNAGSAPLTNVKATLSITGANTFTNVKTIPTLAVGASAIVSFDSYTPTTTGNSVINVTLPSDDNEANNVASTTQMVNRALFGYAEANVPATSSVGFGATAGGIFLAKFTTNGARNLSVINADLEDARSVGRTVFAVLCNSTGAILGRSDDYVVTTTDIGSMKAFTLRTPAVINGDFYIGLAQAAAPSGTAAFFPLGTSAEAPTRTGTFFTAPLAGGTLTDAAASNLGKFMLEAVTTAVVTANSPELQRAIAVYPNPSKGLITLDIHGVAAKGTLQVQVSNLLGQTVYTGTAKNEATNSLNLSSLAAGVYNLKVQNGDQYTVQKLVIE